MVMTNPQLLKARINNALPATCNDHRYGLGMPDQSYRPGSTGDGPARINLGRWLPSSAATLLPRLLPPGFPGLGR